jgi:RNA polymerase sigma-70 factor, ECF subfamily
MTREKIKYSQNDVLTYYHLYFDKVYKFFYYKFLHKETAEDLTSETFLIFIKKLKSGEQLDNVKTYLYGIAYKLFLKNLKIKYQLPTGNVDVNLIEEFVQDFENKLSPEDIISELLPEIPEKPREILYKRFIEKKSLTEICVETGKDMNYVKTTQKRGIHKIRELIKLRGLYPK